eukprot:8473140-Prorocentrum_lima.AAC.1
MTSSLVGSEMCIRDRGDSWEAAADVARPGLERKAGSGGQGSHLTVSYTHLTLPTSVDLGGR